MSKKKKRIILIVSIVLALCLILVGSYFIYIACSEADVPDIEDPDNSNVYLSEPIYGSFAAETLTKDALQGNLAEHAESIDDVLYNGEVFAGVWSGKATVVIMPAAIIMQLSGNGTGWISIGTTDYGYFDYKIVGDVVYMLHHLNIANDKGDTYTDMGTVTINSDGTLTASIKVSLGSINNVKLGARESVTGLSLNEDGTGTLSLSTGGIEFTYTQDVGVYKFYDGDEAIFTALRVSAKGIKVNYRYVETNSSSMATFTGETVVIKP